MRFTFVGDIHSDKNRAMKLKPYTIQLGEFSLYGFDGFSPRKGPVFMVDGNHECFPQINPDAKEPYQLVPNLIYLPRGYVSGTVLFCGGSDSIDRWLRTPGVDWFPEETLSYSQFNRIMNMNRHIETVVSHDCPDFVFPEYPSHSSTSVAFAEIFKQFKPKVWIFGHHHRTVRKTMFDCQFVGLNANEKFEADIPVDAEDFTKFEAFS